MVIKYLDLFSGIGGFRKAIQITANLHGFTSKCIGFSEIDKYALKTYKANFKIEEQEIDYGDIGKITTKLNNNIEKVREKDIDNLIPDFDILFAGFPCQSFSIMGNGKGFADTRGTLFFHIEKILQAKKPNFFLLENVRGLYNHDKKRTFSLMLDILRNKLNYKVIHWILDSSNYGVPQTRRRIYIIGFSKDVLGTDQLSEPPKVDLLNTNTPTTWHILEKNTSLKYFLSKKILKTILSNGTGGYNYKSEINPILAKPICASMHKMHRACQDNYFSKNFINGKYDPINNYITYSKNHNNNIRRLTPLEAFRLQGFPDEFVKNAYSVGVSDTQLYRQAGNAVTIPAVTAILNHIFGHTDLIGNIHKY